MQGRIVRLAAAAAIGVLTVVGASMALQSLSTDRGRDDLNALARPVGDELSHAARAFEMASYGAMRDVVAGAALDEAGRRIEATLSAATASHRFLMIAPLGMASLSQTEKGWETVALAQGGGGPSVDLEAAAAALTAGPALAAWTGAGPVLTAATGSEGAPASGAPRFWTLWRTPSGGGAVAALGEVRLISKTAAMPGRADPARLSAGLAAPGGAPAGATSTDTLLSAHATAALADGALALRLTAPPRRYSEIGLRTLGPPALIALMIVSALIAFAQADRARHALLMRRQRAIMKGVAAKQRALEASEERFRHLAESTNVIPWTADLDTQRFTYVGPQIEALSGYPAATWRAAGFWTQHVHPNDRTHVLTEALERASGGRYATLDYRIRAANGRVLHIRNMLTIVEETAPASDGAPARKATVAHGFMLDVTELKHAAAALEVARRKAEEANRVKSEFLASMSHELRTPLNAVIGFSEIMKEELFGPLDPQYREYAESVHASGRHLLDLINDVLDLSKIEAGRVELSEEATDLVDLMKECRTLLREQIAAAGLHEQFDAPDSLPMARVDPRRIKQVALNLMSNAIKFTPPGGAISVMLNRDADGRLMIGVRDTGVGMAPDEIPKALSKFGQIDGELSRKHDGTGLGLPIAKSLIEMHGGELEVISEKGKGTEMRLWLPAARLVIDAA